MGHPNIHPTTGNLEAKTLTAAILVRVVGTVHVVVALLVFSDALAIVAGELVSRAALCSDEEEKIKGAVSGEEVHPSLGFARSLTVTLLVLVGAVVAVELAVAAQAEVDTLPAVALELCVGANGTILLVAAVVALGEAVAAPCLRDAVHFA